MRKAEKKQAEEFVKMLDQAHEEIRKFIEKGKAEDAKDLLEQCQEGAISLGELIEAREGEQFITISLLEAYCEVVFKIHEELRAAVSVNANSVYKKLKKTLLRISNSIRNDIKIHREVVFLPYKASMWDSLESVWKAAVEDPDCDVYVIPIPYYDKNPGESFGERHYEGDQYPEYVPITRCEDYDFAKHMPDVIFIHNPYDEYNHSTSVDPFFYTLNLKPFTEKLVYIPYFILQEISPDNSKAVEKIKKFITLPGVLYSDKVIVQSEDMRKIYIDVLTREYTIIDREVWEQKILGLGSPKIDKVLSTKKEDLEIPEEWLQIIRKPDGTWKKIVLYNTSISAILAHEEKMLVKIQDALQVFWERRDEITLLWRPHPLTEATIKSGRPRLWREYEKLVEEYISTGWGIYDDTADMNRAIVISDAYYGDNSSLVYLYQKIGKPIMLQNVNVLGKAEDVNS